MQHGSRQVDHRTQRALRFFRQLPAIDRLLRDSSFLSLRDTYGHTR
ncbi:hypothetical protein ACUOCP_45585, partial [Escherichia sp. R-CC3]